MSEGEEITTFLGSFVASEGFVALVVIAAVAYAVLGMLPDQYLRRRVRRSENQWDNALVEKRVPWWAAFLAPLLILYFGPAIPGVPLAEVPAGASRVILALVVLIVAIVVHRLLAAGHQIYELYPVSRKTPIKGFIQAAKLLVLILGVVVAVSVALERSPWGILGGIGALAALLVLAFRDVILSFLAAIQITANNLLDVGDWIEMAEFGADGEVIDIALHTVKVRNWDKTIVTIPTRKLIEGSFKNWQGCGKPADGASNAA